MTGNCRNILLTLLGIRLIFSKLIIYAFIGKSLCFYRHYCIGKSKDNLLDLYLVFVVFGFSIYVNIKAIWNSSIPCFISAIIY